MALTAREEAERLVATVLAVAQRTGVVRDPDPKLAERLATGAGELATGVAGMLRALSSMAGGVGQPSRPRPASPPPHSDAWSAATDAPSSRSEPEPDAEPAELSGTEPWSTATRESNRAAEAAAQAARAARQAARLAEEAARRAREKADEAARLARRRTEEEARRAAGAAGRPFDVWAAATEPMRKSGLAGTDSVDHDGAGHAAGAGEARDGEVDD